MRLPVLLVDAFAERPFCGNPAGVAILEAPLPEPLMQAVAMELAQAETAFVVRRDGAFDIRWFTPMREAAFCGHATLAAAHALAGELGLEGEIAFHTREVGVLRVAVEGGGRYRLDLPRFDPEPLDLAAVAACAPGAREAFRNRENLFAVLGSEAELRAFQPDMAAIAAATGPDGLALTAPGEGADFVSRYFWPTGGIPEDHVTGSIHATLVPFWAARLGRDRLTAVQASRREGRIEGALAGTRVHLTGAAVTTLRGHLDIPD
jgi:predicted PhzF superfamily epimerase YddE/YHI9